MDVAAMVTAGDVHGVTEACLALTANDPVRRSEREAVVAACTAAFKAHTWTGCPDEVERRNDAAAVAAITFAPMQRYLAWSYFRMPSEDLFHRLLIGRDRRFREAFVALIFDLPMKPAFHLARRLIVEGHVARPSSDNYIIGLIGSPAAFVGPSRVTWRGSVLSAMRSAPDLFDGELWRIFEVEGGGEDSLAAHDKYCPADDTWQRALVTLAIEGVLDRQRLLDASLDALQRGFAQFRAGWFAAFHEALAPTLDERSRRAPAYLALTASPIGPTVAFALRALSALQKAALLDPIEVVNGIGPALLSPAKGSALTAVRLLVAAAGADPGLRVEAAPVLVSALGHEASDVQSAAFKALRAWYPAPPADLATLLDAAAQVTHPVVHDELIEWLHATGAGVPAPAVRDLSPHATIPMVALLPVPAWDVAAADWLRTERALHPVTDLDDLFERTSAVLEVPDDPDEIELVIAALTARTDSELATDGRAGTLATRAATLGKSSARTSQRWVALLIGALLARDGATPPVPALGERVPAGDWRPRAAGLGNLMALRVNELITASSTRERTRPMTVATPTHRGGIIDPVVLAERLLAVASTDEPGEADLQMALLRLAPSHARSTEAIEQLRGNQRVPALVQNWLEAWPDACASDAVTRLDWRTSAHPTTAGTYHQLHIDGVEHPLTPVRAPLTTFLPLDFSAAADLPWELTFDAPLVRWLGTVAPGMPEAWARCGALGLNEAGWGEIALLDRFFDPDVAIGPAARLLIGLALNDGRPAMSNRAVDLTIEAITQVRLDPVVFGAIVGALVGSGLTVPPRWATSFGLVATASPLHHCWTRAAVEAAVAGATPVRPQDLLAILELYEVLLLEGGGNVDDPAARSTLHTITGSGKTAKVAKRLLAIERVR